jgi:hypothetical protein
VREERRGFFPKPTTTTPAFLYFYPASVEKYRSVIEIIMNKCESTREIIYTKQELEDLALVYSYTRIGVVLDLLLARFYS